MDAFRVPTQLVSNTLVLWTAEDPALVGAVITPELDAVFACCYYMAV